MRGILLTALFIPCLVLADYGELGNILSKERLDELSKILGGSSYSSIGGWNIGCDRDKFDNSKKCSVFNYTSDVMINLINGKYSVYVGGNHFPNSQSAIKIDNHATVYGREGISQTPLKVIEQMKEGKVAYTRYREWPYNYNRDGEVDLGGFAEKFEEMLVEYEKL